MNKWTYSLREEFSPVQLLSHVRLIVTPWTAACQASLSITSSQSLLKLVSIALVMPSKRGSLKSRQSSGVSSLGTSFVRNWATWHAHLWWKRSSTLQSQWIKRILKSIRWSWNRKSFGIPLLRWMDPCSRFWLWKQIDPEEWKGGECWKRVNSEVTVLPIIFRGDKDSLKDVCSGWSMVSCLALLGTQQKCFIFYREWRTAMSLFFQRLCLTGGTDSQHSELRLFHHYLHTKGLDKFPYENIPQCTGFLQEDWWSFLSDVGQQNPWAEVGMKGMEKSACQARDLTESELSKI